MGEKDEYSVGVRVYDGIGSKTEIYIHVSEDFVDFFGVGVNRDFSRGSDAWAVLRDK